ncbi:hypothetical protein [Musicola paradisiaca]|uniref:Uncharacterized protein n=1 Tax=Musicola paradisiaca (strain Ech703) TaxID=579405 RepID=C6C8C7_MUSP7|nr:hypothetical protein [Musicola paradisiaca]ACS86093.1 hypothetical protein Dd703_2309 [Musicola paradisiaca Ech703]
MIRLSDTMVKKVITFIFSSVMITGGCAAMIHLDVFLSMNEGQHEYALPSQGDASIDKGHYQISRTVKHIMAAVVHLQRGEREYAVPNVIQAAKALQDSRMALQAFQRDSHSDAVRDHVSEVGLAWQQLLDKGLEPMLQTAHAGLPETTTQHYQYHFTPLRQRFEHTLSRYQDALNQEKTQSTRLPYADSVWSLMLATLLAALLVLTLRHPALGDVSRRLWQGFRRYLRR